MSKTQGPGGQWVKPWRRLDYVQSQLRCALYTLERGLQWGDNNLLTEPELALLGLLRAALETCEEINDAA